MFSLTLVYEKGDESTKQGLVSGLLSTVSFTSFSLNRNWTSHSLVVSRLLKERKGSRLLETARFYRRDFWETLEMPLRTKKFVVSQKTWSNRGVFLILFSFSWRVDRNLTLFRLVYNFMNLATHNAIWNSKKGAAFAAHALTKTGAGGKDVLAPYLENLVPKLFRSSYDPSYNVSQAMVRIKNTEGRCEGGFCSTDLILDSHSWLRCKP